MAKMNPFFSILIKVFLF